MSLLSRTLRLPSALKIDLLYSYRSFPLTLPGRSPTLRLPPCVGRDISTAARLQAEVAPNSLASKTAPPTVGKPTSSQDGKAQDTHFVDAPAKLQEDDPTHIDWTRSFHGLSTEPFSKEAADVLQGPLSADDVEIKPDGIIYLPEIKYRRILNKAFGPGGWGLAPRSETIVTDKAVTREYALLAHGR